MTEQAIKFSLYSGLYARQPEKQISLDDLYQLTAGNLLKLKTQEVRRLTLEGRIPEADAVKKSLPAIAVAGHFGERRRAECLVAMNGMMLVDIDDARQKPAALVEQCRTLPYVAFASVSVRGGGVHLLVRIGKVDPAAYRTVCLAVAAAITRQTGEKVDESCFDLPRTMLLSHDPDCYMNPEAVPFEVPATEETPPAAPPARSRIAGSTPQQRLAQYLDKADLSLVWVKGSRHTALTSLAGCLNLAGFDEVSAAAECVHRYANSDFGEAEIRRTIASIYAAGRAEFGQNEREKQPSEKRGSAKSATETPVLSDDEARDRAECKVAEKERVKCTLEGYKPIVYERLHPFLKEMVALMEPGRTRDMALLGILTIMSTITPRVRGSYEEEIVHPQFFSVITGYPGSGKGVLNKIRALYSGWHRHVRETSRRAVEKYEQEMLIYTRDLAHWHKKKEGNPPEKTTEVKQMELSIAGDITKAKLIEQLAANEAYPALLHETEMRVIAVAMQQENGKFADVFNRLAHHEEVARNTKCSGRFSIETPRMGVIASGVPEQIPALFGSMDDGLASRFLGYMVPDEVVWKNLTDSDDTPDRANHFLQFSERVTQIGIHLDMYKTFLSFSHEQRERMNSTFGSMVEIARLMGEADRKAFLFRNALTVFRIAMTLSAIRKATDGVTEEYIKIHPDDFEVALSIALTGLNHMLAMSTLLVHRKESGTVKSPSLRKELFADLPDCFFSDQACAMGKERLVSKRTIYNWLADWCSTPVLTKVSMGYYEKTSLGKHCSIANKKRG